MIVVISTTIPTFATAIIINIINPIFVIFIDIINNSDGNGHEDNNKNTIDNNIYKQNNK